ncbi:MAG: energy transducer TonB, partial [Raineya sp.]
MDLQSYCYQAHEGFEGRNQEYGAYVMRRDYSGIVTRVLIFVIVASGLIFAAPMIQRLLTPEEKVEVQQQVVEQEVELPVDLIEEEEQKEEEKKTEVVIEVPPPPEVEQIKFTEIKVTEEKPEVPELKSNEEVEQKQAVIAAEDKTGVATDAPPEKLDFSEKPSEDPGKGGTGEEDGNKVYTEFEVVKNAEYEGGINAFRKELQSKINYPSLARRKETQGKVTLQFTVEKDGSITDIKILKDIGDGCVDEAVA